MAGVNDGIGRMNKKIISFLMIGQSNMAGRGDFGEVEPINNELCYMLRMGRWQPMNEPINPDRPVFGTMFHSGVGLAASFADEMAKYSGSSIGLIPCADGWTSIAEWMPGEVLFDHAVMMTKLAMRTSDFGGIIWHQGEKDCVRYDPERYKNNLITMMTELRRALDAENKPIILGELSEQIGKEEVWRNETPKMNMLLREIASELPHCAVASSSGLTMKADGIHFDSKSLRELGRRYFKKYIEIAKL